MTTYCQRFDVLYGMTEVELKEEINMLTKEAIVNDETNTFETHEGISSTFRNDENEIWFMHRDKVVDNLYDELNRIVVIKKILQMKISKV